MPIPFRATVGIVGILYDSVLEAAQNREIKSWRNSLIDRHLKYLFNNALNLGTRAADLMNSMKFPMKINIISRKKMPIFSAAFCAVLRRKLKAP